MALARKPDYTTWSKEELVKRIDALEKRKKYGLVWEEKPEEVVEMCKEKLPVLKEVKNKGIITNKDKPVNLLIEGDNYHALSVLNYTHAKKVDVIYIDPPYNTGARDWKYNNDYVDQNDAYRHSKWLSFMHNRLILAKNLLSREGVLVCTVDDNEQARLGVLLEELFPSKQITCVTIVHNPAGIQGNNFSYCHEYAYFIYPKLGRFIGYQIRDDQDLDIRNFRDVTGEESLRNAAVNCFYPIYVKDGKIKGFGPVSNKDFHPNKINITREDGLIEIYPVDPQGVERKWRFARHTVESIKNELRAKYIKGRKVWDIIRLKNKFNYKTVWIDPKYSSNNYGTQLLNKIIKRNSFSFPKSIYAVLDCIKAASNDNKNAIVLDFFAGSGTTGHAVLELNKQDSGRRKFILCTNNENNIATEVCYPRIQKVIKGYKNPSGDKIEGLGGNLKYFKTSFVPSEPTDKNKEMLTKQSIEMLCLREDTFDFVSETDTIKIFRNKEKYTGILFDQMEIPNFKKIIKEFDKPVSVYVFSLSDDDFAEEFADMRDKVKVCSIPEAILRVYRRIFK